MCNKLQYKQQTNYSLIYLHATIIAAFIITAAQEWGSQSPVRPLKRGRPFSVHVAISILQ